MRPLLALALALALALRVELAIAQPSPLLEARAENRFPDGVLFSLRLERGMAVQEARLHYRLGPRAILGVVAPELPSSTPREVSYLLGWPKTYLPPGLAITFWWEVVDPQGRTFSTEPQTFTYTDPRFPFHVLEEGKFRLYWYDDEGNARLLLRVATETLQEMEALLGVEVPFPIQVWVYADTEDMRKALVPRSESFERQVITAGQKVADDTVLVAGSRSLDTLRHELAHIVTAVAGEGPFGGLPAWLDEGTAVYAQKSPGAFQLAFQRAVAQDALLPLPSLSSYPGDPKLVNLFYGQSWALVSYLIETYGRERFAQLFATFKAGATTDDALRRVYGLGVYELENQWRASLGLPPVVVPSPTAAPGESTTNRALPKGERTPWPLVGVGASVGALMLVAAYLLGRRLRAG